MDRHRLVTVTAFTLMGVLLGSLPAAAAQETRLDASADRSGGAGYRVAMDEKVKRGSPNRPWNRQSEVYWTGSTYVRWPTAAATDVVPYAMCFFDYYMTKFSDNVFLTDPYFSSELFLGDDTSVLVMNNLPAQKASVLKLRTCVFGSRLARNPHLGGGRYTMSVHAPLRVRVKSLKHTIDAYIYLTEDEWTAKTPQYRERIADKITFKKKNGGGGVIIVAS